MNRIYFKENDILDKKDKAFFLFLKKTGAIYFEDDEGSCYHEDDEESKYGLYVAPKKYDKEGDLLAIKLIDNGNIELGRIDKDCDNFNEGVGELFKQEAKWIRDTIDKILKLK